MKGEVVGNYRIIGLLGSGGMGAVYEAEHVLLGKKAAIKVLLPERSVNKEIVDRFFNEAKASTAVRHPGIVEIFDYGHLPNGNAYLVMELLEGESLGTRLHRVDRLPASQAVSIVRQVAGVLSAAHGHGIIHRDLKPDNVFLVPDPLLPRGERIKVVDFGIAKLAGRSDTGLVSTESGRIMGTPVYMSPEQCRGSGQIDQRSDVYALGCVFFQMVCGRPPFLAEGAGEVLAAHIHLRPPVPSVYEPTVPPPVEDVVMKLLEKRPEDRYLSMEELVVDLNAVATYLQAEDAPEPSLAASSKHRRIDVSTHPHPSTTLRSTAGEISQTGHRQRGGRALRLGLALGALGAAAAALAVFLPLDSPGGAAEEASASAGAAALAGQDQDGSAEEIVREPLVRKLDPSELGAPGAESGAEESVVVRIESEPLGARIYRGGERVGRTPVTLELERGSREAVFFVRKSGYRSARIVVTGERDRTERVVLEREEEGRGKGKGERDEIGDEGVGLSSDQDQDQDQDQVQVHGGQDGKADAGVPELPGEDEAADPFRFFQGGKE